MSIARYLTAAGLALGVTLGLLLLMHVLIQTNISGPGEVVEYRVPDIVMPQRQIETKFDVSKPEKPQEVETPPPDIPQPEFDTPDASNEGIAIETKFDAKPTITGPTGFGDGDMIPPGGANRERRLLHHRVYGFGKRYDKRRFCCRLP
jgi:protein TonB